MLTVNAMNLNSLAIIPDGNRRYASKNGLRLAEAYKAGFSRAEELLEWVAEAKTIKTVTMYSLSLENFLRRSALEKQVLFRLFSEHFRRIPEDERISKYGIRINVIGKRELLPGKVRTAISEAERSTAHNSKRLLNVALCYSGREEIVDAVRRICAAQANGALDAGRITQEYLSKNLYLSSEPDLLIRTGGVKRLSGFLTWQSPYSELYFSEKLWPEFSRSDFNDALQCYYASERRFGR
jgi:tritrans,polycis-undecaprenyl-diphosphate synthase [geranylgeranyl-diphosphate specific]